MSDSNKNRGWNEAELKLRWRTYLLMVLTLVGAVFAVEVISQTVFMRGFANVERTQMQDQVKRAQSAVRQDLDALGADVFSYSAWDDTVRFIETGNQGFVDSNLTDSFFTGFRANLAVIVKNDGTIVYGQGFDLEKSRVTAMPTGLLRYLTPDSPLVKHSGADGRVSGILMLAEGPMLIDSQPILTSQAEGPVLGAVLMGRWLDDAKVAELARVTLLSLSFEPAGTTELPGDVRQALASAGPTADPVVKPVDAHTVAGYGLLNDIFGQPALILRVATPRAVFAQGSKSVRYFVYALVAVMLAFGLTMGQILERSVFGRLTRLTWAVRRVKSEDGRFDHVTLRGRDELSELAGTVDSAFVELNDLRTTALADRARFESIVSHSTDVITVVDVDGTISYQTPSVKRVLGLEPAQLLGARLAGIVHPKDAPWVRSYLAALASREGARATVEWRFRNSSGDWVAIETTGANLLEDPNVRGIVLTSRDVGERKAMDEELTRLALHDPLTGLANRALFSDRLEHALAQSSRNRSHVAVLFMDLDDFKNINDSLGHVVGDRLLALVAKRLRGLLRSSDTAARLGGDEFAVLLEGESSTLQASYVAERILGSLRKPFQVGATQVSASVSIGVAISSPGNENLEELLRNADLALYAAKAEGKARFRIYEAEMHAAVCARLKSEAELRRALDNQEIVAYYQPILSAKTGKIVGVEALARWNHPTKGLVLPAEFISLAESTGLIVPLGLSVLEQACRSMHEWHERGADPDLVLAVNLSPRQLSQPQVAERVVHILKECSLAPETLILEITESVLMDEPSDILATLSKLKSYGIKLSIDDFGTGYSSLSYLQRYPIDILKIPRSFLIGGDSHSEVSPLVEAIVALGRSLKMEVVAEGIETKEQLEGLVALGCDMWQGYLHSRPEVASVVLQCLLGERSRCASCDQSDSCAGRSC
jgi:diguanylate cyclase (GGDEF)-like protein/PAS domain S-box-containing protein